MSDDERYQIIGKVVSDHEAAKKHLAALQAKAANTAELFHAIANVLTGNADSIAASPDTDEFGVKNRHSGAKSNGRYPAWQDVARLVADIAETKKQIGELEARRKDLGIS